MPPSPRIFCSDAVDLRACRQRRSAGRTNAVTAEEEEMDRKFLVDSTISALVFKPTSSVEEPKPDFWGPASTSFFLADKQLLLK